MVREGASDWFNRRARIYWYDQYALNEQATAFAQYDPDRIVAELEATGAEIITLYATNQFGIAYYPSKIWPQHPNLKGRDYFGEILERLRARGKRVMAYTNFLDSKRAEWRVLPLEHENDPEWRRDKPLVSWADPATPGRRVQALAGGAWEHSCHNSPHRDQVLAVAEEILSRYHPDMFHIDMFVIGYICVCQYCRPQLQKLLGTDIITREVLRQQWKKYADWRLKTSADFLAELSAVARKHGALATHNAFAPLYLPPFMGLGERWLDSLDVFISECFDAFCAPLTDLNSTSINVRWQHAVGKPSWILRTSHQLHYAHWPITNAQWEVYAAACKANGCKVFGPCGVGARPDTTTSRRMLDNVKHGLDFYMKDADLDDGAESAAKVALVFSWASRNYYSDDMQWVEEFVGWARLLIEEHLPYDIVVAERMKVADDLKRYDLVILPNVANMSDEFASVIASYVRGGGRVLATAETSLRNESNELRADYALGDTLGIEHRGSMQGHFAVERPGEPEPASGRFQKVATKANVLARHVAVDPAGSVAGCEDPLPLEPTDLPAAVLHGCGKGKALYVACDIGRYYNLHGDEHIGIWMAELLDEILPKRQIIVKAPRTVEVTVWRQRKHKRTVIHLANRTVAWSLPTDARQFTEVIPVHGIDLSLPTPRAQVKVGARGARVRSKIVGNRLVISVPRLDSYAAVLIEPS